MRHINFLAVVWAIALLFVWADARAAKVPVELVTPTQNTDGTPLTDLAKVTIEWGSCSGAAFGTKQAAIDIVTTKTGVQLNSFIYPTGLARVCARAYAINSKGVSSDASNVASKDLLPSTGKPVTLGAPVILKFTSDKEEF